MVGVRRFALLVVRRTHGAPGQLRGQSVPHRDQVRREQQRHHGAGDDESEHIGTDELEAAAFIRDDERQLADVRQRPARDQRRLQRIAQ